MTRTYPPVFLHKLGAPLLIARFSWSEPTGPSGNTTDQYMHGRMLDGRTPEHCNQETVYERLLAGIVAGRISPGTVMLPGAIAGRASAAVDTIANALEMLASEGLLISDAGSYTVAIASPWEISHFLDL